MTRDAGLDAGWLRALQEQLDAPPAQPRLPLALAIGSAPRRLIGSIESTLALDLAGAGIALRDAGDAWQLELPDAAAVNPALARLADGLRAGGHATMWRNELLDVTDSADTVQGVIERAAVRPLGIATRAVHLVVADARDSVWIAQRALDKAVDPGCWDTTMGGLVAAGETIAQTLARETWEEAGWRLAQLQGIAPLGRFTVRRPVTGGYMVEHIEMFEAVAPDGTLPSNQDGEVAGFACIDRVQLGARLQAGAFTLEAAVVLVRWLRGDR